MWELPDASVGKCKLGQNSKVQPLAFLSSPSAVASVDMNFLGCTSCFHLKQQLFLCHILLNSFTFVFY